MMSSIKRLCCVLALLLTAALPGLAAEETGFRFLRHYTTDEYNAHAQNWTVLQDRRGVMYFGNGQGVLEYDGTRWRLIETSNRVRVRALSQDDAGRIYVGAVNEIGYLAPDPRGRLQFQSLNEFVPPDRRNFGEVWHVQTIADGTYFLTYGQIFRWDGSRLTTIPPPRPDATFHNLFKVDGRLYVSIRNAGLFRLTPVGIEPLPGGALFAPHRVYAMVSRPDGSILIGTREVGLFSYDGNTFTPCLPELGKRLTAAQLYHGVILPDGRYGFATLREGLIVATPDGRVSETINRATGLPEDIAFKVFCDRQGAIWLGTDNGIARVELLSPLSFFDERAGLKGINLTVRRHQGRLYAGTMTGLYVLTSSTDPPSVPRGGPIFAPIPNLASQVWGLGSLDEDLLAATSEGVMVVRNGTVTRVTDRYSYCVGNSRLIPGRIYVGFRGGISVLQREGTATWKEIGTIADLTAEIRTIIEAPSGELWAGSESNGLFRIRLRDNPSLRPPFSTTVENFGTDRGLPALEGNNPFQVFDSILFGTKTGLYRFDAAAGRFVPETRFGNITGTYLLRVGTESGGNIWIGWNDQLPGVIVRQPDGGYRWQERPLPSLPRGGTYVIFPEDDGVVWLGGTKGLFRVDTRFRHNTASDFSTLVRRVVAGRDTMVFEGIASNGSAPVLAHRDNRLRFECAAPAYSQESSNRFQFFLEGADTEWSEWSADSVKEYTNLWEGRYTFRVRARDLFGNIGREAAFEFRVRPPWYRTWWALLGLTLALVGLIYAGVQRRERTLRTRNLELEAKVARRTADLAVKVEALRRSEQAALEAKEEAQRANRSKSEFLAGISHELRTPLNAILGFAQLTARAPDLAPETRENLGIIVRSGEHLLGLINDVLSISKIEAGKTTLTENIFSLRDLVKGIGDLFRLRATEKSIAFAIDVAADVPDIVRGDEGKLRQIFINLISNAIKFTDRGSVETELTFAAGRLHVAVRDTGHGIAPDELATLFTPFSQTESGRNSTEGTGLGLSICKSYITLMGGEIRAASELGAGSSFTFEIPLTIVAETDRRTGNPRLAVGFEGTETYRALVVDDVADNRTLLVKLLASLGFETREAANGREAVETWTEWQPEVVLMDIRMPVMTGFEAVQAIREREDAGSGGRRTIIIALSASVFEQNREQVFSAGCDAFIPKPFRAEFVADTLAHHLGTRVRYAAPTTDQAPAAPFSRDGLEAGWARRLEVALQSGDITDGLKIVGEIEPVNGRAAATLAGLIRQYRFEEAQALLAPLLNGATQTK